MRGYSHVCFRKYVPQQKPSVQKYDIPAILRNSVHASKPAIGFAARVAVIETPNCVRANGRNVGGLRGTVATQLIVSLRCSRPSSERRKLGRQLPVTSKRVTTACDLLSFVTCHFGLSAVIVLHRYIPLGHFGELSSGQTPFRPGRRSTPEVKERQRGARWF